MSLGQVSQKTQEGHVQAAKEATIKNLILRNTTKKNNEVGRRGGRNEAHEEEDKQTQMNIGKKTGVINHIRKKTEKRSKMMTNRRTLQAGEHDEVDKHAGEHDDAEQATRPSR